MRNYSRRNKLCSRTKIFTRLLSLMAFSVCISGLNALYAQKLLVKEEGLDLIAPRVSPKGDFLSLTTKGYKGLWIVRSDGYDLRQFSDMRGAGYIARWSPDSKWIIFREDEYEGNKRTQRLRIAEVYTGNVSDVRTPWKNFDDVHWFGSNEILIRDRGRNRMSDSGIALKRGRRTPPILYAEQKTIVIIYPGVDKPKIINPVIGADYIRPVLSPDGKKVAFEVIGGNLHVYEMSTFHLYDMGPGESAQWSPNSKKIVYQITLDDGHRMTGSDIYIIDADGSKKVRLTTTSDVFEMRPTFFPNGRTVIYDTDERGEIMRIDVSRR